MRKYLSVLLVVCASTLAQCQCNDRPATITRKTGAEHDPVTVVAVGDILLADAAESLLKTKGYSSPFGFLKPLLKGDLVVGNLEGPISAQPAPAFPDKAWSYQADSLAAKALFDAGIHYLDLANNHILDFGIRGFDQTREALSENNLESFGAGSNEKEARQGIVVEIKGIKIGLLGYMEDWWTYRRYDYYATEKNTGVARLTEQNITEDMARMRQECDVVLVFCHWGVNYEGVKSTQKRFAKFAVQHGADAVIGHHPHMPQGIEEIEGVPVIYSLGNFTFGSGGRFNLVEPWQRRGLVAKLTIESRRVSSLEVTPIETDNTVIKYQPKRTSGAETKAMVERLKEGSTKLEYNEEKKVIVWRKKAPRLRVKEARCVVG